MRLLSLLLLLCFGCVSKADVKKLEADIDALKKADTAIYGSMEAHFSKYKEDHEAIMGRLRCIDDQQIGTLNSLEAVQFKVGQMEVAQAAEAELARREADNDWDWDVRIQTIEGCIPCLQYEQALLGAVPTRQMRVGQKKFVKATRDGDSMIVLVEKLEGDVGVQYPDITIRTEEGDFFPLGDTQAILAERTWNSLRKRGKKVGQVYPKEL